MILGITGGTGCGKTTALRALQSLGAVALDCDEIYHTLLATDPALCAAIGARFPAAVEDGRVDRQALARQVFSNARELAALNAITHAAVKAEVLRRLTPAPALAAIDAIALFESGIAELCDITVAVTAPEDVRVARLMARDRISREDAAMRIAAQKPQSFFVRSCDHTLENDGDEAAFRTKCLAFFRKLAIIGSEKPKEEF